MLADWRYKPYKPFFLVAVLSLAIAFMYRIFSPETYFDLSFYDYMTLNNFYLWIVFSAYIFLLSAIYYIVHKKGLHARTWLIRSHFIFIILFLLLLFTFSLFNTVPFQQVTSGMPFLVLFGIYGTIFFIDLVLFVIGLLILLVNIFSLKKD
jgi:hypothetical protein